MPLALLCRARKSAIWRRGWSFGSKRSAMFGRSNECTTTRGRRSNRRSTMSSRVAASAVAVKASVWMLPSTERARAISRYSGLKSCPHWETQWASSMASRRAPISRSRAASPCAKRRSGETNSRRSSLRRRSRQASSASSSLVAELRVAARTPKPHICWTWSRISAISGETTMVSAPSTIAGNW